MAVINNLDFIYPLNYTYDDSKIEIDSGEAELVPTTSALNPISYWYCENDSNVLVDSLGINELDGNGGFNASNFDLSGLINKCIHGNGAWYLTKSGIFGFQRTDSFTAECWVKTSSSGTEIIMGRQNSIAPTPGWTLSLSAGKARFAIKDDNSNLIAVRSNSNVNTGSWVHVVATYDGTSTENGMEIYINGALDTVVDTSGTLNTSISATVDFQISGRGVALFISSNTYLDEILMYEHALDSTEVEYRYNEGNGTRSLGVPSGYDTNNPTIIPTQPMYAQSLTTFLETSVITGSDNIKYVLTVDGTDTYWDGGSWVESSGYAQSNTATEINTNLATLDLTGGKVIIPKIYLHSNDGTSTPTLKNLYMVYDFTLGSTATYPTTSVTGQLQGIDNTAIVGASIKAKLKKFSTATIAQFPQSFNTTVTDASGNWSLDLVPSTELNTVSEYTFLFSYTDSNNNLIEYRVDKVVPNISIINFSDL